MQECGSLVYVLAPHETNPTETDLDRDRLVDICVWLVVAVAGLASLAGWVGLAEMAGWSQHWRPDSGSPIQFRVSWLLPLCVDVFAFANFRVVLNPRTPTGLRVYAGICAAVTTALGVSANAVFHILVSRGITEPGVTTVVGVGALPPVMAMAATVLAALRRNRNEKSSNETSETVAARHVSPAVENRPVSFQVSPVVLDHDRPVYPERVETASIETRTETRIAKTVSVSRGDQDYLDAVRSKHPDWRTRKLTYEEIKDAAKISGQATTKRIRDQLYSKETG